MRKKKLSLFPPVLAVLLLLASCSSECSHVYDLQVTREATCIKQGEQRYTCGLCGHTYTVPTPTTDHNYTAAVTREATCKEAGEITHSCTMCSDSRTERTELTGHSYGPYTMTTEPTCTSPGTETSLCSVCGEARTTEVPALTHAFGDYTVTTEPTCTQEGIETSLCTLCGGAMTRPVGSLGHNYIESVQTQATSSVPGVKLFRCERCGDSYTEEYILTAYSGTEVYHQAVTSVGEITTYDKAGNGLSIGTGFVYAADGQVVTNYHVMEGAYSAQIVFGDRVYDITHVLAYDKTIDLAVVQVNVVDDSTALSPLTICPDPVPVGSTVYTLGSSRGLTATFSQGIVSYSDRVLDGVSFVQHDAAISGGNSGGPLLNVYGEVVGINTMTITDSQNLNFAIATSEISRLVYGEALTVAEFYEKEVSPYDILLAWLWDNYNDFSPTSIDATEYVEYTDSSTSYYISYDLEYEYLYLCSYVVYDTDLMLLLAIDLSTPPEAYEFFASAGMEDLWLNDTYGSLHAPSYTGNTPLVYDTFDGLEEVHDALVNLYQLEFFYLLDWADTYMQENGTGLTLADFGFTSF